MSDSQIRFFPDSEPVFDVAFFQKTEGFTELEQELLHLRYIRIRAIGIASSIIDKKTNVKTAQTTKELIQAACLADALYRRIVSAEKREHQRGG